VALAGTATPHTWKRGETLFAEGAAPDGLHFIRQGSVTVSKKGGGREQIVSYLQAGNYLGETSLLDPDGRRNATVRAAIQTETVCVPADAMHGLLAHYPAIRAEFERRAREFAEEEITKLFNTRATDLVSFLERAGVGEATDLLLIDESLCIRCNNCEKACAETHGGVSRLDREGGPSFGSFHVTAACQHCENPKCMDDCPPDALRREPNGEVVIDDTCIGCGNCVTNCPYGVIQLAQVSPPKRPSALWRFLFGEGSGADSTDGEKLAVKCDLCSELPPAPGRARAACVASCPTNAILRVDPRRLIDQLQKGEL
jgi:Fe-S-cluster-containing hydrogenase component 2